MSLKFITFKTIKLILNGSHFQPLLGGNWKQQLPSLFKTMLDFSSSIALYHINNIPKDNYYVWLSPWPCNDFCTF